MLLSRFVEALDGESSVDSLGRLASACWARVQRGGSWQGFASRCRPAQRHKDYPETWGHGILGFRLVRAE